MGILPSQTTVNPRENGSVITLKSGKHLKAKDKEVEPLPTLKTMNITPQQPLRLALKSSLHHTSLLHYLAIWLTSLRRNKKKVLNTLGKVHINIPLLDAIKHVPRYAKKLKDLCIKKRKLKGNVIMYVGENCTIALQRKLPLKLKDHGVS